MTESLCRSCALCKEVVSGKGSKFWFCLLSHDDRRYPKYPPQPVFRCDGYKRNEAEAGAAEQAAP